MLSLWATRLLILFQPGQALSALSTVKGGAEQCHSWKNVKLLQILGIGCMPLFHKPLITFCLSARKQMCQPGILSLRMILVYMTLLLIACFTAEAFE